MSIFSKLFNSGKKDYTYNGPRPPSSLTEVRGGQDYYNNIQDRLAGRGVGFGDSYASQYANPIIKNQRNTFESYVVPELKSELSATGRRGGSAGFAQLAKAYGDQALNEGDIFSRLQQRNEDQSRREINDALSSLGNFANNEANLKDQYANFEYNKIYQPQVDREQQRLANESAGYQGLLDRGLQAVGFGISNSTPNPYGGGIPTGSYVQSGYQSYPVTTPPYGYNYGNINSRLAARNGQIGRVA